MRHKWLAGVLLGVLMVPLGTAPAPAQTEFEVVDGVLQPLPDGFPSEPITLWNAFEPGSGDDVFNQLVSRIGAKYAPVPITTATQTIGPTLHYGLVEFLKDRPGADQGYHIYPISWFGVTTRLFTSEALQDRPLQELRESLQPINEMRFAPYSFLAEKDGPFETIQDVEEYARENPGDLVIASSQPGGGISTSTYVWAAQAGGIDFTYLPTEGPTQAQQVLLGGGAQMATSRTEPELDERFNFLMVTGDSRVAAFPDVPAAGELGYNIPSGSSLGYGTLTDVPREHVDWLWEWLRMVSEDPDFQEQYAGVMDLTYRTPEEVEQGRDAVLEVFVPILEEQDLVVREDY